MVTCFVVTPTVELDPAAPEVDDTLLFALVPFALDVLRPVSKSSWAGGKVLRELQPRTTVTSMASTAGKQQGAFEGALRACRALSVDP